MMGQQTGIQPKIFYLHMNLEQRVHRDHLLRRIQEQIDFNFIYAEVRDAYGSKGNVSPGSYLIIEIFSCSLKDKIIFRSAPKCQYLSLAPGFFPSEKGTWVRLFHPPVKGKLMRGFEGLDVGDRVRVELIGTDVERGFIDFVRTGKRHNPDSSVLPAQLPSCFRTNVPSF